MAGGSQINHFAPTRIRGVCVGNLDLQMQSLGDVNTQTLVPLAMATTNARELNRLMNFTSQYGKLKLSTNVIDEVMNVRSIIIFLKRLWGDYPG